jgi:hypothetical protein
MSTAVRWCFPLNFSNKIIFAAYISRMHVARRTRIILCDILTLIDAMYGEEQKKYEKSTLVFAHINQIYSNFQIF